MASPTYFDTRRKVHDEIAVPQVGECFSSHGFETEPWGTEHRNGRLSDVLRFHHDPTSALIRHQPDLAAYYPHQHYRSVLCEVKCDPNGHRNFAIEIDSLRSAQELCAGRHHVMYALVDVNDEQIYGCWANDIPRPSTIFVPARPWDFEQTWERLSREWPDVVLVQKPYRPGPNASGTPYILLSKKSAFLQPLHGFIQSSLRDADIGAPTGR